MRAFLIAFALLALAPVAALAQSDPGLYNGQVPTATQWNSFFAAKADYPVGGVCAPNTVYGNPSGGSAAPSCNPATGLTGVGSALKWVSPITLNLGGVLTGSVSVDGSANVTLTGALSNSGVTSGTWGDGTHTPQFTVNSEGRITNVVSVPISASSGTVATTGSPTSGQIAKFSGAFTITNAVSGTDYLGPTSGSALQKANGSGGLTAATAGTDYAGFTANAFTGLQTFSGGAVITPEATPATNEAGYLGAPQNLQNGTYGLVLTDAGKFIYHTSGSAHTWTIPANASVAFPIGTTIVLANEHGGGNVTIAITSDTLRWTTSTGSRTLAADGTATLLKVDSTTWRLTGDGIS